MGTHSRTNVQTKLILNYISISRTFSSTARVDNMSEKNSPSPQISLPGSLSNSNAGSSDKISGDQNDPISKSNYSYVNGYNPVCKTSFRIILFHIAAV